MLKNFSFENLAVYKIMWKITVQPDRPQVTYNTAHAHCKLKN